MTLRQLEDKVTERWLYLLELPLRFTYQFFFYFDALLIRLCLRQRRMRRAFY